MLQLHNPESGMSWHVALHLLVDMTVANPEHSCESRHPGHCFAMFRTTGNHRRSGRVYGVVRSGGCSALMPP